MSEQPHSKDPVVDALDLEKGIADNTLDNPVDASARKAVRQRMELWMEMMNNPEIAKVYKEKLGELDPEVAKKDMLNQIGARFPGVAKDFGWDPKAAMNANNEMTA